jgi:hypothetical protein
MIKYVRCSLFFAARRVAVTGGNTILGKRRVIPINASETGQLRGTEIDRRGDSGVRAASWRDA